MDSDPIRVPEEDVTVTNYDPTDPIHRAYAEGVKQVYESLQEELDAIFKGQHVDEEA